MQISRSAVLLTAISPNFLWALGCQSYWPQPLDLAAHRDAWLARSPESEPVAAFALHLAASTPAEVPAFGVADGLTVHEAELVALVFNAHLRRLRLEAGVARATADNAGLWHDPTLDVGLERILDGVDHPWIAGGIIGITIPLSGRLDAEKGEAAAAYDTAIQRILAEEWRVRIAVRSAWLEWSAALRRAELARDTLSHVEEVASIVERLVRAGELGRVDSRLFLVERATRRSDVPLLDSRAKEAELAIRSILGLSPAAPLSLVPGSLAAPPGAPSAELAALLESRNADLATLRTEYEVAEQHLRLEVRKQYPDLTIGPGGKYEDGDGRVLLGLSLPLPLWNRNQLGVAEALAQRDLARAAFETAFERLAGELATTEVRLEAARSLRLALESDVVPLVDEQYGDVRRIAELGHLDAFVLLDAVTRQASVKTRLIDSYLDEALAASAIDALTGPPPSPIHPETLPSLQEDTRP